MEARPTTPTTPTSDTASISSSNKENHPPPLTADYDGCSTSTNDTDPTTEDETNPFKPVLPEDITYPEFLRYCTDSERRADLFQEIKDGCANQTLTTLLELFHQTFELE